MGDWPHLPVWFLARSETGPRSSGNSGQRTRAFAPSCRYFEETIPKHSGPPTRRPATGSLSSAGSNCRPGTKRIILLRSSPSWPLRTFLGEERQCHRLYEALAEPTRATNLGRASVPTKISARLTGNEAIGRYEWMQVRKRSGISFPVSWTPRGRVLSRLPHPR